MPVSDAFTQGIAYAVAPGPQHRAAVGTGLLENVQNESYDSVTSPVSIETIEFQLQSSRHIE
jgi:hypothetical protein